MIRTSSLIAVLLLAAGPAGASAQLAGQLQQNRFGGRLVQPAGQPLHTPFVEPMTAAKIRTAIEDAVMGLDI